MNDSFRNLQRLAVDYDDHLRAGTQNSEYGMAVLEEIACHYCHASNEEVEAFNHFTSYLDRRRNEMSIAKKNKNFLKFLPLKGPTIVVYESRFGFHPVSYETFRKLKFLHKWYYQTLKDHARWRRWNRKFPHNRKGPEPQYCSFFVQNHRWRSKDYGIVDAYQQARMPASREEVEINLRFMLSVEKIDKMYEEVKSWVN
jgi:hypothetical protein